MQDYKGVLCCLKSRIHTEEANAETFRVTVKLFKKSPVLYESYQPGRKIYTLIYRTKKNMDLLITYEIELPTGKIKKSYDLKEVFENFLKGDIAQNKKYLQKIDINQNLKLTQSFYFSYSVGLVKTICKLNLYVDNGLKTAADKYEYQHTAEEFLQDQNRTLNQKEKSKLALQAICKAEQAEKDLQTEIQEFRRTLKKTSYKTKPIFARSIIDRLLILLALLLLGLAAGALRHWYADRVVKKK